MTQTDDKAKEASVPRWFDWASRTTAILAVLAALSSGRWGASNLQAILEQGKVNDTWAYYQSKSIMEKQAAQMRDLVSALSSGSANPEALQKLKSQFSADAEHEAENKAQRQAEAREYEKSRDSLVARGFWFEISFACLQLGVIFCTIATGAKARGAWFFGIFLGLLGLLVLLNGFYPVVPAPRGMYQRTSDAMEAHPAPAHSATPIPDNP